jgi:hypothetical protein|tara:strand:- start:1122 stop:1241 length:120 start_codon:yes stop_codon:yes gene_type:complete
MWYDLFTAGIAAVLPVKREPPVSKMSSRFTGKSAAKTKV